MNFSQEEYSPDDPANPCVNYPTEEYSSYADCDDEFVRRSLPSSLKPFWAVDNISEASNVVSVARDVWDHMDYGIYRYIVFYRVSEENIHLDRLFNGLLVSDCLPPCVRTEASVEEGTKTNYNSSMFSLTFNDKVRVKVTSVDQFSFMGALNYFGSNLGLWPGLGLYQILEWVRGLLIVGQALRGIRRVMKIILSGECTGWF